MATIPTSMPTTNRPGNLGVAISDHATRLDAVAKVTGSAKYARDVFPAGCLFAAFVRCPYGHGVLEGVDDAAARRVPGVVEVEVETGGRSRYQGHNVGHVLAESLPALRDGMRALAARWRQRDCNTRITDVIGDPPAPNDETRRLLDGAAHVLEAIYETPVQTHSALETHGAVVEHDGERATAWVSTQGTNAAAQGLEDAIGVPRSRYEVRCEFIGGGFGSKLNGAGKEGVLAARLAVKHRRPVYVFCDRAEDHVDTGNRPSSRTIVRMGITGSGRIVGGQIQTYGNVGVADRGGGVRINQQGRYDLGVVQQDHQDVQLNSGAPRPFRAPGWPQGVFAEELMLDELAALALVDPLELRLRHETQEARREMLELGARLIGWDERAANGAGSGVLRRGFGCGTTGWPRYPSVSEAQVVINRDGSVEARTGTQDIGTGQRTIMGITAAEAIGIPLDRVEVRIGNSTLPTGPGSGGSVTAANTVPSMREAALAARVRLLSDLAEALDVDPSELEIEDGRLLRNGEEIMGWERACSRIGRDGIVGNGRWDRSRLREDDSTGHSQGVQFVDLRVDVETGVVHVDRVVAIQACGRVVCRKTAESQIIGGVIQGLSFALFEEKILDRNVGAMVNANLEWYRILGTDDMPHIEPVLWADGGNGVRPLGEPPTIPTAGAVACAVYNAIGAPVRSLPLTPARVLDAAAIAGAPA